MGGFSDLMSDTWDDLSTLGVGVLTGGASLALEALKPDDPRQPPANPATDPAAIAERDRVAREEQIRRLLGGRESTIQTSPMGLSSAATVASKSLLGS